ncbi:hypothetical protein ACNKHM_10935 [Shigella sonnei]
MDRDNAKVTRHYNSRIRPLRALDYAVQAVHRQGKWIGCAVNWKRRFRAAVAGRFRAG